MLFGHIADTLGGAPDEKLENFAEAQTQIINITADMLY
jgi:hypothetical protein